MRILAGCLALAALGGSLVPARTAEPTRGELEELERQLTTTLDRVTPAVACVVVSRSDRYPKPAKSPDYPGRLGGFDRKEFLAAEPGRDRLADELDLSDPQTVPDHSFAGGVVIDPAGLVLVNYHTIDGATKIYVHLSGMPGSYADVHAADARSDLAVLKLLVPPAGLKPIRFAAVRLPDVGGRTATVAAGKLLVLMTCPYASGFGKGRPSAGLGSVTNVGRLGRAPKGQEQPRSLYNYAPLIEYDTRLNAGRSGAALLNLDGELIGLTTAAAAATGAESGPGYALPADTYMRRIVDVLCRGEEVEYGFLGVSRRDDMGIRPGFVVETVTPRSPAAAGGVLPGDAIVRIDGHPVSDFGDLLFHAGSALAGTKIRLTVRRAGEEVERDVTLAKYKGDTPFIAAVRPEPVFGLRVDYGSVLAQTLLGPFSTVVVPPGVMVRELVPDSPAAARFKALGDNTRWLVTHVNGIPTATPAEFYQAVKGQPTVKLTVTDPGSDVPRVRDVTLP